MDNFKRKRIDPMNLLRNIQQLEQNQMQCNISNSTNMDTTSMWNIQPAQQSPLSNITEVKAEPFLSPNYYGSSYRNSYQASPSPQPTSPMMNRNITTPSPGLMRNSSAESQSQMSNVYNQSQMNQEQYQNLNNNFNMSTSITNSHQTQGAAEYNNTNAFFENNNNSNFNMISSQQQTQFSSSNMFVNRTSGGSFTPIYDNTINNSNQNNTNTQLQSMNITNNIQQVQAVFGTTNNMIFNQFQETNTTTDSSLFNLSQLDDLVPLQNSDELRMSNLSIST
ncbi:dr1-associated corepressor homolog [Lucilia sericata]|uniref:dr1-associated corepressor homolog n=1 Tax=Lucilia sericata TaxID=13632 RepID=UPI0018A81433|nr:dr1-associated corepressor homolog [Lucilia sericata]